MQVDKVIAMCGGATTIAAKLNIHRSTISQWKRRGSIPSRRLFALKALAENRGATLNLDDIIRCID
jgi:DNA invertase Pin-like site-specific DNA recombinase